MKTSLPERSEHVAEKLAEITGVIRKVVGEDLAMLILFGSYARGDWVQDRYTEDNITYTYESDFDLLVVSENRAHGTSNGEWWLTDAIGRRLHRLGLDRPSSMVIVEDLEHLNKALQPRPLFLRGHPEGRRAPVRQRPSHVGRASSPRSGRPSEVRPRGF